MTTIPIDSIRESLTNPRKTFGDLSELAESIKAIGLVHPLLVRPVLDPLGEDEVPQYELVSGHRRLRAAREAKLFELEAVVRDLSDDQVLEAQLAENLHREDVHPIEEAEVYAWLQRERELDVADIATKVGKSETYVRDRLVLTALVDEAREVFYGGRMTIGAAVRWAKMIPQDRQAELLEKELHGTLHAGDVAHIASRYIVRSLSSAPFSTKAKTLTDAGPCTKCPKRSDTQAELFDGHSAPYHASCMDPACYEAKTLASWTQAKAAAEKAGRTIVEDPPSSAFTYDARLSYGGPYVGAGEKCFEDRQYRTYGELMKEAGEAALEPVLLRAPNGAAVEALPRKGLEAALKAAGVDGAKSATGGGGKAALECRIAKETGRRLTAAAAEKAAADGTSASFWSLMLELVLDNTWAEALKAVADRAGLDTKTATPQVAIQEAARAGTVEQTRAFAVELLLFKYANWDSRLQLVCKELNVDTAAIKRQVRKDLKPKKKAKKKKKVKTSKKRRSGKGAKAVEDLKETNRKKRKKKARRKAARKNG